MKLHKRITAAVIAALLFNMSWGNFASAQTLEIPYAAFNNITLPEKTSDGEQIIWTSDTPSVIANDGKVTRPDSTQDSKTVTLTASYGGGYDEYKILVPHMGSLNKEVLAHDFDSGEGLDLSELASGEISFKSDGGADYMLLNNTKSNSSTVTINLESPVGGAKETNVKIRINPCKTTSFKFYSDKGYEVAKAQMHSSGGFLVGFSNEGTQKNIGAKGSWLELDYSFSFNTNTPSESTFTLSSNGSVKYPEGTPIFRTDKNKIGTNIKRISITTTKNDGTDSPSGTAVDSIVVTESVGEGTDDAVIAAAKKLEIANADDITSDIELPESIDGCEVVWASSDAEVIENDGKAHLPKNGESSKYAELTAFIILGESIIEKKFSLTLNPYVDKRLVEDANLVKIPEIITEDIILPEFKNGTSASFICEREDILSEDGKITRPADKSVILPFKIRFENESDFIEREYKAIVAKEMSYLKMDMVYEDFENIKDPTDALFYINSGGEKHGEINIITDEITNSTCISSKKTGSNFQPEFRFNSFSGKAVIEFDARIMCEGANFAYIYGDGICSSMTYANGAIQVRGAEQSINFLTGVTSDKWYHFKFLIDTTDYLAGMGDCTTDIWVDGVKYVTGLKTRANSTMINRILTAPTEAGGEMRYDNLKVYTDYSETVKASAEKLEFARRDAVINDYIFPARTDDGMNIEIISEKPEYITSDGKVTRPKKDEEDVKVNVYALVYKDTFMALKTFEFTVLHQYSDDVSVEKDTDALTLGNLSDVRGDIILPTLGANGSLITWETSDSSTITTDGKVIRPGYIEASRYKEVTLKATLKKGDALSEKEFKAYVAKNNFINNAYVRCESQSDTNPTVYINDESYDTFWSPSVYGEQEIVIDLSKSMLANKLVIFEKGTISGVKLGYSLDGSKYYNITPTKSADGRIIADFDKTAVRYIKIETTIGEGSGISEIELYCYTSELDLINEDIEKLEEIGFNNLKTDITLPEKGENGSVIVWKSSDENAIGNDGRVYRKSSVQRLTLKATLTLGGTERSVEFSASVAAKDSGGSSGGVGGGGGSSSGGSQNAVLPIFTNSQTMKDATVTKPVFDDLTGYSWAEEAINKLYNEGIVSGRGEGKYAPGDNITRAEFVKLLCEVIDIEEGFAQFLDVSDNDWFAPYVRRAAAGGIIYGSDGKFKPNDSITREDMAVIISRALKLTTENAPEFTDSNDISEYAKAGVAALSENKIMQGDSGMFMPKKNATRAEAAMVIYTIFNRG